MSFDFPFYQRQLYAPWSPIEGERVVCVVTYDVARHFIEGADPTTFASLKPAWRRLYEKQVQAAGYLSGAKPPYVLTGIKSRMRDTDTRPAGRLVIDHDVDPTTYVTRAYHVFVMARKGVSADVIRAMRKKYSSRPLSLTQSGGIKVRSIGREDARRAREGARAGSQGAPASEQATPCCGRGQWEEEEGRWRGCRSRG